MPTNAQYEDHQWVVDRLKDCQEADHDMREQAREAHEFVTHRQGQWEPHWYEQNKGKPRYTFDLVNPIIDQVTGSMEQSDFSVRVSPAGGDASEDAAEIYDGLIRNIENLSRAKSIYNRTSREAVTCGLDGWRVIQKYADGDSFDQDLIIEKVPNYLDRVWHGPHEEPDASDARFCWILSGMDSEEFKQRYPDANESSVEQDKSSNAYYHRNDQVMVGEFLYLKEVPHDIVLMSNGAVYAADELEMVADELAAAGITEEKRRTRKKHVVYSRLFSADQWLSEARETVFENWLPVIPMYGNFKVYEDKVTYHGVVEKLMDAQRVFNYSLSREIEEGALAPRAKYWMTEKQAEGHEETLATLNTNSDPVQFYTPDMEAPGVPMQSGGAQVNPGLRNISESMRGIVAQTAGMFAANMGDNPALQSGIAIEALQDRGDTGNNKYVEAREVAQRHTGRILVDAIPRVYSSGRMIRVLGEDGSAETVTLGQMVQDQQTGQVVTLNDLSQGTYDVTCESGPAFKNRQNETVSTLVELGKVDPSIIEIGGDILANNVSSPGMRDVAARKRQQLFNAGLIPQDQMTDEELQQLQAQQNQEPQEDPNMVLARAEEAKAQADLMEVQRKAQESQQEFQLKIQSLSIDQAKLEIDRAKAQIEAAQAGVEVKMKGAQAAKALAEAEAVDLENTAFESGIIKLLESQGGA
jgi:hypothetical protein